MNLSAGDDVVRLNALTILFYAVLATAFPTNFKHEAAVDQAAPAQQPELATATLPEFVSLSNLSSFLLASEGLTPVSTETRLAAEALSAKFASSSGGSERAFLHAVVQADPVAINLVDAPKDPEKPPRVRNNIEEAPRSATRVEPRGPRRVKIAQPTFAKQRPERRQLASIETPSTGDAATDAPQSDLAEPSMSPMLAKCGTAPKPCQGNETWCGC